MTRSKAPRASSNLNNTLPLNYEHNRKDSGDLSGITLTSHKHVLVQSSSMVSATMNNS